jgi:hypothetical protein
MRFDKLDFILIFVLSNNNKMKTRITKSQILKMERASRRESVIESGMYGSFTKNVVHKSKKSYTRKEKHSKSYL